MAKGIPPIAPGTLVRHDSFGKGTVVKDRPGTHRGYVSVFFPDSKKKADGTTGGKVRRVPQAELKLR